MNEKEKEEEPLRLLLQKQYQHAEEYCNAQTRLHSALVDNRPHSQLDQLLFHHTLQRALEDMKESTDKVRSDLVSLEESRTEVANHNLHKALQTHLETSHRIVQTMFHSGGRFHTSGIPANKDDYESKMVALATLRASIETLEAVFTSS